MFAVFLKISIIFTFIVPHVRCQWTRYSNKLDKTLSSFCAASDNYGNVHLSGGLSGFTYLSTSYHFHVSRGRAPASMKARHKIQLSTIFVGWYMDVVGFSCEGPSMAHYQDSVFYIGINDHSNLPKCFACNADDKCDDLTSSQCTPNFGTCVVQDGSVAYVIGGSRGITVSSDIKRFDLATKQMTTAPNYGSLNTPVHHAGCAKVGTKLVIVGGGYADRNFAPRWQVCEENGPCTLHTNLPNQVLNPGVVANLNGNSNCDVVVMGGELISGATSQSYILNACTGSVSPVAPPALPIPLQAFSSVVTNGLLCVLGGLDNTWKQSSDVVCRNFGAVPQTTSTTTLRPTRTPTVKPTNPPSARPTDRPTGRPTFAPTTQRPTQSPTPPPTHADDSTPVFSPTWKVVTRLGHGLSSSACGIDSESGDLMMAGGRQFDSSGQQFQHNSALYWTRRSSLADRTSLLAKRTFPQYGPNFQEVLQGMYTVHQSTVRWKGKTYICSPQYFNPRNVAEFLKCEKKGNQLHCFNICNSRLTSCPILSFSPCCVNVGRYLYWIGGSLGTRVYTDIVKYDMDTDTFVTPSQYGPLAQGVHASSCAVWNDRIYVFGGNSDKSARGTTHIQVCPPTTDPCRMSSAVLGEPQTYGQAVTLGSSMVIGCATGASFSAAAPALYDAYTDKLKSNFKPGPMLQGRTECCMTKFGGNLTVLGGYQDDSVITNGITQQDRLRNCLNIIVSGRAFSSYDGSYRQVKIRSLRTSENVWRSHKNWIFYSDAAKAFWIWSSEAYCFRPDLKSGPWTSYAARGRRSTVDLTLTCNDEFVSGKIPAEDPCAKWSWECEKTRAVVIALACVVGSLCFIVGCCLLCRLRKQQKLELKQKSVNRVPSRSTQGRYATITVNDMYPDAGGLELEGTQHIAAVNGSDGNLTDDDSHVLDDDDKGIEYDLDNRPGDVDESTYYYQQTKYTQDVLFPQPRPQ